MASLSERPTPAGIETTEGDQVFRNPIITFVGAAASIPPYRQSAAKRLRKPFQASADRRSMGARTAVLRARPAKAFPISRRRPAASTLVLRTRRATPRTASAGEGGFRFPVNPK